MEERTLVILGICGFLTVCFGLLVLVVATIFRFTGRNFMGFLGLLLQGAKDDDKNENSNQHIHRPPNLRDLAASSDFNAALAKHIVQDEISPTLNTTAPIPGGAQTGFTSLSPGTPASPALSPEGSLPRRIQPPPPPVSAPPLSPYVPSGVNNPPVSPYAVPPPFGAPSNMPPAAPIVPTPESLGWENPALPSVNQNTHRDQRRQDEEDGADIFGALLGNGDDDGGVLR